MAQNDNLPSIEDLGKKIENAKKAIEQENEDIKPVAATMRIGVDLLAGVLVGSFIGYNLDKWLGTLPVFFIICFFLGIAGAARNIIRFIKN